VDSTKFTTVEVVKAGTGSCVDSPNAEGFSLSQNYPNPVNPITKIRYALPGVGDQPSAVRLEVYNILGEKVATLVNEQQPPGYKVVTWNAKDVGSGIYFYRLQAGEFVETKRMVVIK